MISRVGFDPHWLQRLSGSASYEGMRRHEKRTRPRTDGGRNRRKGVVKLTCRSDRAAWVARADSAVPADARTACKRLGDQR